MGLPGQDGEDEGHDEPGVGHHLPHRLLLRGETGEFDSSLNSMMGWQIIVKERHVISKAIQMSSIDT